MSSPLTLELVGPAGAGKSTLMAALAQHAGAVGGVRIRLQQHWPLACAAALAGRRRAGSRAYARALSSALGTPVPGMVLLDEGPVFRLARMRLAQSGGSSLTTGPLRRALRRWADTVDGLLWLDAPDPVLAERIRARGKAHRIKEGSDVEITRFLADYRAAYEWVMQEIGPRVVRIESGERAAAEVADEAMARIRQEWPEW